MAHYEISLDAFVVEELRHQYLSADVSGRIALLQSNTLPFEIARLAVEDPNVEVRQWFARNGREYREVSENAGSGVRSSVRDLLAILRKDPDPFVRACVCANPAFSPPLSIITDGRIEFSKEWWSEATHLERLSMVRHSDFLRSKILDELESNELGLSLEQRKELIWAFLAGRDEADHRGSSKLWKLVSEWPEETELQALVYRFLPTDDETAAEIYQITQRPEWRRAILCMVWDEKERSENSGKVPYQYAYSSTLNLAMTDRDPACRLLAYAWARIGEKKYWMVSGFKDRARRRKESRKLLRASRDDIYALSGLANNLSLSPSELQWVQRRAPVLSGSLKSEVTLWINLGGDEGYTISEKDLWSIIRHDVERTISKLRLERAVSKLRVSDSNRSTPESKVEWTEGEKFDYLTSLSLNSSLWAIFAQCCGVASGLGLIVFSISYILGGSLALALFLFLLCSWLGWLLAYRVFQSTQALPPWVGAKII
jgi:hypothetical protein